MQEAVAARTVEPGASPAPADSRSFGRRFVAALAAKDAAGMRALLADEAEFRALTPRRVFEASTGDGVVDVIVGTWLAGERIDAVEATESSSIEPAEGDARHRIGYRLRGFGPDGPFIVEQQAFYQLTDGRISWMRLVCSGFLPVSGD
jgi:hypothetical protein